MSVVFLDYEQQFSKLLNAIQQKTQGIPNQSRELKESAITEGGQQLLEAEKFLRQMEIEVSMMPLASRAQLQTVLRRYREDLDKAKREFRAEEKAYTDQKTKETLMGSRLDNQGFEGNHKLLNSNSLIQQNAKLQQGIQQLHQAEGDQIETMNQLRLQREQIHNIQDGAREIGENLSGSNKLLTTMTRRAVTNKIIMTGTLVLMVALVVLLIYMKVA